MEKLIITAAICGAEVTKAQNEAVPYTVEEMVREAKSAYEAGAAILDIHVREDVGEEEFVALRTRRDATLEMPVLLLPAIQVNMRCGAFPEPEDNGVRYLKIPLNAL